MKLGKLKNAQLSKQSHEIGFVQRVQLKQVFCPAALFLWLDLNLPNRYHTASSIFLQNQHIENHLLHLPYLEGIAYL